MKKHEEQTIVLTGGGSGGHVTPLAAISQELAAQAPRIRQVYIGSAKDKIAGSMLSEAGLGLCYKTVPSGKLRRYKGLGTRQKLKIWRHYAINIADLIQTVLGVVKALWLLYRLKPRAVFSKGGYPALPVCLAAVLLRIPLVTHDSDGVPGLTHRIVARWTKQRMHGVPVRAEGQKDVYVGVPVRHVFSSVKARRRSIRSQLGLASNQKLVIVTGGGLGSLHLSMAAVDSFTQLGRDVRMVVLTGEVSYREVLACAEDLSEQQRSRLSVEAFSDQMPELMAAADVLVTRGGATAMAEAAAVGVPTICIPNGQLSGGHQTVNARLFQQAEAVLALVPAHPTNVVDARRLSQQLKLVLDNQELRTKLSKNLQALARPRAVNDIVRLITETANVLA